MLYLQLQLQLLISLSALCCKVALRQYYVKLKTLSKAYATKYSLKYF